MGMKAVISGEDSLLGKFIVHESALAKFVFSGTVKDECT